MHRIILIHAYKQEAQRWERLLRVHDLAEVRLALTFETALKEVEQGAATIVLDVSAVGMLAAQMDVWMRQLDRLPPVILTGETSESLLSYGTLPVAVRLTWQEARQALPQWARLTLQLHEARGGQGQPVPSQPESLRWERWLPWLTDFFDPTTHFAREPLFLEALVDLAATAQREREPLTIIALALDAWEKRLKNWHPHETVAIRREVARAMMMQTSSLSPFLATPEPGLFWLALVGCAQEDALVIAENLRQSLPQHLPLAMTASFGVASFRIPKRNDNGHAVLAAAMDALREARSAGAAQIRVALLLPSPSKRSA